MELTRQIFKKEELEALKDTGKLTYCIIRYERDEELVGYDKLLWEKYDSEDECMTKYKELNEDKGRNNRSIIYAVECYLKDEEE